MATRNPYIGSSLDEFLAEDGSLEEVTAGLDAALNGAAA